MYADARIATAFEAMLRGIEAPPVPMNAIQSRISAPQRDRREAPRYLRPVVAAAAIIALAIVALPALAPGFAQSIEQRIAELLQWTPPPPPPKSVMSALVSKPATLASAQSRVTFTIVPPAGLPADVTSEKIWTSPVAVYSKTTRSWSVGSPAVTFEYGRSGGRSFSLGAEVYDTAAGMPARYIYDADEKDARGLPVRHENFVWRNGNQLMSTTDEGITVREIDAIRVAMHGQSVPLAVTKQELNAGSEVKMYHVGPP